MAIYIVNALMVILLSAVYSSKFKVTSSLKISGKRVYIVVIFILFFCIMAFRAVSVGVDTSPYSRIYTIIGRSGSLRSALANAPLSAPIYVVFCWLLYHISSDPQLLIIASSLIVTVGLFKFIEKASDNIIISCNCWIGLTMFYASMNGNRQFMALVLILNAFYYLTFSITSMKGWGLFALAVGIHSTAIFSLIALLGVMLAKKLKANKLIFLTSVIISVVRKR